MAPLWLRRPQKADFLPQYWNSNAFCEADSLVALFCRALIVDGVFRAGLFAQRMNGLSRRRRRRAQTSSRMRTERAACFVFGGKRVARPSSEPCIL
jgi:hypothetical protein